MSSDQPQVSQDECRVLRQREKARREALWRLSGVRPGDPAAVGILLVLDEVDGDDRSNPIGGGHALSVEAVRDLVPLTQIRKMLVVRDEDIPEPWSERFLQASTLSTRLAEGSYSHDWQSFLSLWIKEMDFLAHHRECRELWRVEGRRWCLLERLLALEPQDPGAIPILAELHDLQGSDESQIPSLAVVREAIQQRLSDGHLTVWDSWLPLPWSLRLAHYLGTTITARQGWRVEDWEGFLSAWDAGMAQLARHQAV
ncbi:hypothetical protein [Pseudomonas abietaniphila]|uniref:hypothetical protein n=1 Tax=Pseudomonas abietaniphila TaxID=89065 RepID=UPI0007833FD9|nr:hypothetical protein [Pseudomonas abietaniphila]